MTGEPPPHRPPQAKEYKAAGIPWFDYYNAVSAMASLCPNKAHCVMRRVKAAGMQLYGRLDQATEAPRKLRRLKPIVALAWCGVIPPRHASIVICSALALVWHLVGQLFSALTSVCFYLFNGVPKERRLTVPCRAMLFHNSLSFRI